MQTSGINRMIKSVQSIPSFCSLGIASWISSSPEEFDGHSSASPAPVSWSQPRSQGTLSTSRKYPGYGWSRV